MNPDDDEKIHVMVPLSGAAVGTDYLAHVINGLSRGTQRYRFHIVAQLSLRSVQFLNKLSSVKSVDLHVSQSTREVVNDYEAVYARHPIAFEITKPSEQAFKALLKPGQVGGSILFFTHPVGRWERDNLAFLRRHKFIPTVKETEDMFQADLRGQESDWYGQAGNWRGMQLPDNPEEAVKMIKKNMGDGIFMRMMNCNINGREKSGRPETDSHGAERLWKIVDKLLGGRS